MLKDRKTVCAVSMWFGWTKNLCTAVNCRLALDLNQTGHFVILVFFFLHHDHIVPQATTQCSCQVTSVEEAKKHFSLKLKTQTCICRHKLQGKQILVSNLNCLMCVGFVFPDTSAASHVSTSENKINQVLFACGLCLCLQRENILKQTKETERCWL